MADRDRFLSFLPLTRELLRLTVGLSLAACTVFSQQALVLVNGKVWTGAAAKPYVSAVAMREGRIVAAGTDAQARAAAPGARVIDLKGAFAMPGFNDAHVHFLGGSQGLTKVELTGVCTLDDIQRAVLRWARLNPEAPWVTGGGWEYTCFPDGRLPTRQDLDAVVPDRPVFLSAYDGHTAWVNSKALAMAGVTKDTKFSGFGEVKRDAAGEPTGALLEGAQGLVRRIVPRDTAAQRRKALEEGLKLAASLGITSLQNASGNQEEVELYEEFRRAGKLTARIYFALSAGQMDDRLEEIAKLRAAYPGPVIKLGAVKFMLDGVIESHTAGMLEPYSDTANGDRGKLAWEPEAYRRAVQKADQLGLQIFTHAIGDRAVRLALDAYEQAGKANGGRDARFRIEHIETVHPTDVPRFAKLGVIASMEPIHCDPDTVAVWSKAVGPERLKLAFAWRAFEKAGAKLVFSSDWPASIALDPIRGLHNAVNRRTTSGKPEGGWIPEHRVSVETALRAYTSTAAYASFDDSVKGTIEPGKLADVVVLSQDPLAVPPMELHKTKVKLTVFDGRVVFEAK
jgi:predicted amidohydrolase YtcJ